VRMVRGGPEDVELSHGRRGDEGKAARAIPGRRPPPPATAPAATTSTSARTPTWSPPQREIYRAKAVIDSSHFAIQPFTSSSPILNRHRHDWKAGWLMSALAVANERRSTGSLGGTNNPPWFKLPVASHPSAATTSRQVTSHPLRFILNRLHPPAAIVTDPPF
jgi:hypothetical protein